MRKVFLLLFKCLLFTSALKATEVPFDWDNYFRITSTWANPNPTTIIAQKSFLEENKTNGSAVDLGAGTGKDTLFLLKQGWRVLALDAAERSIEIILERVGRAYLSRLEVMRTSFSDMTLPDQLDLVNASYSLPFCEPQDFPRCWKTIVDHLAVGGRFSGHFFGEKHTWATNPSLTIHHYDQVLELFKNQFVVEYFQVEDRVKPIADGELTHWHVFHVVAKKVR